MSNEVGERIKKRRLEMHMSQEELAEKMGYTNKSTISKIESGVNDITQSKVKQFAEVLNTNIPYLMGWIEDDTPKSDDESRMLSYFRVLNDSQKETIIKMAMYMAGEEDAGI